MRKGFTLLELLVVIGIMGILATFILTGLSGLREQSRDDRRVADLRQVQQALQLFHLKCGFYPGRYIQSSNECKYENPNSWRELGENLKNAEIGIYSIPNDPIPSKDYRYWISLEDKINKIAASQCYILGAEMETAHKSLKNKDQLKNKQPLESLYPSRVDCSDSQMMYCIGNIECKDFFK